MNFILSKNILNEILECIHLLNKDELTIKITKDAWILQIANLPLYTAIITIQINKTEFKKYQLIDDYLNFKNHNLTIVYTPLYKIIKNFEDFICINISPSDNKIIFSNENISNFLSLSYTSDEFNISEFNIDYQTSFRINIKEFVTILQPVTLISHKLNCKINSETNKLKISAIENSQNVNWFIDVDQINFIKEQDDTDFKIEISNEFISFLKLYKEFATIMVCSGYAILVKPSKENYSVTGLFSLIE